MQPILHLVHLPSSSLLVQYYRSGSHTAMAHAKIFDFSNNKKLMDIGGGSGVYEIEVVKENPKMFTTVLDLGSACCGIHFITCPCISNPLLV